MLTNKFANYLIALVWLANGFLCKILNLVPRHQQIVASILGSDYARRLTLLIGLMEIIMAIWIISRYQTKANAIIQIIVIIVMNILEFVTVPDLLLWGKLNIIFALIFVSFIYYNEFIVNGGVSLKHPNEIS